MRSRQTVEVILEATAQVLEANGLAAFNTNAVAARAGVSVGSIYQYFPGKDALMAALSRREAERFQAALSRVWALASGLPLPDAVRAFASLAVDHQTSRPTLARILDLEERRLGIDAEAEAAARTTMSRLAGFLMARQLPDPETAARDLLNMARGMIDGALHADPVDLADRVCRAALGYLERSTAPGGQVPPNATLGGEVSQARNPGGVDDR